MATSTTAPSPWGPTARSVTCRSSSGVDRSPETDTRWPAPASMALGRRVAMRFPPRSTAIVAVTAAPGPSASAGVMAINRRV